MSAAIGVPRKCTCATPRTIVSREADLDLPLFWVPERFKSERDSVHFTSLDSAKAAAAARSRQ